MHLLKDANVAESDEPSTLRLLVDHEHASLVLDRTRLDSQVRQVLRQKQRVNKLCVRVRVVLHEQ